MITYWLSAKRGIILSMLALCLCSCTSIRLISAYDEITDKNISALQEKVSGFFVEIKEVIGTEQAQYKHYNSFYRDVKTALEGLQIRANAIDKNELVQQQLVLLAQQLADLETLHKKGFNNTAVLQSAQEACNRSFTAIIRLQLALKRGEK